MGAVFMFDSDLFDNVIIWKSKRTDFARVISEYQESRKKRPSIGTNPKSIASFNEGH
jgi:hypothetical protein